MSAEEGTLSDISQEDKQYMENSRSESDENAQIEDLLLREEAPRKE
jgi:hypothetical protein